MQYIKSPLNYIGNKYRILNQIQNLFPKNISLMVDLFCGGCDVAVNTSADKVIANDINVYLIHILDAFKQQSSNNILAYIDSTIAQWQLSKSNKNAYLAFRQHYNVTKNPLDLYILMCFSFNYQFRFNLAHEYNNPFGNKRSSFSPKMRKNLVNFIDRLQKVEVSSYDFLYFNYDILHAGDFIYADPPYLITCGSYNDGRRGFKGWQKNDEMALYDTLDALHKKGIKFALSNVLAHKGATNTLLLDWQTRNNYTLHRVRCNYDNCNYHAKNKNTVTEEVLITNYHR